MDWQAFWDKKALHEDPHVQVARTKGGKQSDKQELAKIAAYIKEKLELSEEDTLLDLCCGNGMLSKELSPFVKELLGVDFSEPHIEIARQQFIAPNVMFLRGNATKLALLTEKSFDKINLYFSFQYFDTYKMGELVVKEMAKCLKPGGKILIGDVPDKERLAVFYPKPMDRFRYHLARIRGRDQMGKFWSEAEMQKIAAASGLQIQKLKQPADFLYQHYRSDYLLWKE
ncbi:MAG: methyltransferase domain-containing protein [Bacteroidia bacterium]|nr:methyltransferase domain-containing protein [Bacteroidia bacterium]